VTPRKSRPAAGGRISDDALEKLVHYVSIARDNGPADGTGAQVYVPQIHDALLELRTRRAFDEAHLEFAYVGSLKGKPPHWLALKRDKNGRTVGGPHEGPTAYEAGVAALTALGDGEPD
jgi:hypothetical protein